MGEREDLTLYMFIPDIKMHERDLREIMLCLRRKPLSFPTRTNGALYTSTPYTQCTIPDLKGKLGYYTGVESGESILE